MTKVCDTCCEFHINHGSLTNISAVDCWQKCASLIVPICVNYLGHLCHILVNFVPILCELWDDFEKTGLFTRVKYVLFWSILCQFCANNGTILKWGGCLLGSNMSYFGQFCANFVWSSWRKEGVFQLGQICPILKRRGCLTGSNMSYFGQFCANFVWIIWQFRKEGVVYWG